MKRITVFTIIAVLLLFVFSPAFAQEARITDLVGTVELKPAGAAAWVSAVQGQTIAKGTMVSTGFKSYAIIRAGNSVINVRPLTRLSLEEISQQNQAETINVALRAGRVRTELNPPAGTRSSMNLTTPVATASVRGTVFEMVVFALWVIEGSIEYRGTTGSRVIVDAGGYSFFNEKSGRVAFTKETLITSLSPVQPIALDSYKSRHSTAPQQQQSRILELSGKLDF